MTFRFSVSAIFGIFITAALFLGMLSLLKQKPVVFDTDDMNINFSFVKDYKAPTEQKEPPKEIPEPKEVIQPPAAPTLKVSVNDSPDINIPLDGISKNTPNLLSDIKIPGVGSDGPVISGPSGGIKQAIPPMYPPQELVKRTEGWVQVQISVNEFGAVSSISVLDAKPKRVFDAATKKAIKKWKFHPKIADGKAVPFTATQTIEFKLDQ